MPKVIELTFELNIDRVTCPGVWLCQVGRVALTVFTLGKSYQTSLAPPIFPINFRNTFYFRKRFEEPCSLGNICCLLKEETIYCELVQWSEDCANSTCTILAQYLGSLNDILFPPNMCSNEGVDLLMRRSKNYPGILAPKIEVKTKVRIDEVWNSTCKPPPRIAARIQPCTCGPGGTKFEPFDPRTRQVCHTPLYHRLKGHRAGESLSRSCCSLAQRKDFNCNDKCRQRHQYHVYNVKTPPMSTSWKNVTNHNVSSSDSEFDYELHPMSEKRKEVETFWKPDTRKPLLESRYLEPDTCLSPEISKVKKCHLVKKIDPCLCDICKRYYDLFLSNRPL